MASATLQRYLAEAVWLPTALMPSAGVVWTAIDDLTARATLSTGVEWTLPSGPMPYSRRRITNVAYEF